MVAMLTSVAIAQAPNKPLTPLKIQVTIARYEGDKKVSSLPYILAVTANGPQGVSMRMGSEVPLPSGPGVVNYRNIGTNIDCSASSIDDARFAVRLTVNDSSIMERRSSEAAPTLRSFSTSNEVVLKDGQTAQFTAAADKTTGEVMKVDVTLTVEK
jgi:hypothetical protein